MAVLEINTIDPNITYQMQGEYSGLRGFAKKIGEDKIRIYLNDRYSDYKTLSGFTDFVIDSVNPSDANDAVTKINSIINF